MPLVRTCEGGGRAIWCPACGHAHVLGPDWRWNGDPERPTFTPSHRQWGAHGYCHVLVQGGTIYYQQDCGHGMAGQSTTLQDF